jgi:crotonobetainyl-CoA:carnitine CoA-transferase CaiB-like acyl-CoA transferase
MLRRDPDAVPTDAGLAAERRSRLSDTPATYRRPAPALGEHNAEVLAEWAGYTPDYRAELLAAGVIADRPPS